MCVSYSPSPSPSPPPQPERIKVSTNSYDIRADIWSLGISLVELVTGSSPYALDRFHTEFALLSHIVDAEPPLPDKDKFSPEFYSFIAQWWVWPPVNRVFNPLATVGMLLWR